MRCDPSAQERRTRRVAVGGGSRLAASAYRSSAAENAEQDAQESVATAYCARWPRERTREGGAAEAPKPPLDAFGVQLTSPLLLEKAAFTCHARRHCTPAAGLTPLPHEQDIIVQMGI